MPLTLHLSPDLGQYLAQEAQQNALTTDALPPDGHGGLLVQQTAIATAVGLIRSPEQGAEVAGFSLNGLKQGAAPSH
jgi:hypothetical protein